MLATIREPFQFLGVGLHSGKTTQVRVLPAEDGEGRYFVRVDLPKQPIIPAQVNFVSQTTLSTELSQGIATVRTIEHLLAALVGNGVENARIEIDGSEVPLLDGSAQEWSQAITNVGVTPGKNRDYPPKLTSPVFVQEGDAFVMAMPATEIRFSYGIDFPYQAIGNQWYSWNPEQETFQEAIAPARTFGFADQIEQLRQAGLIKGGSLENALVCNEKGWINPPLRFANEPVRHKLLDLVGDLSLLGVIPQAHFLAYKASHTLHIRLAKALEASLTQ
jgi:UDP-3-O-[3-hydroxymyristoyl] N-acetylglucosamine deacetylase